MKQSIAGALRRRDADVTEPYIANYDFTSERVFRTLNIIRIQGRKP